MSELLIPDGINFDCTCCGNCCFEWPVPITREDFSRIETYAQEKSLDSKQLFRVLRTDDEKLNAFSHSLEKRDADGLCQFLTADKRCQLQNEHGPQFKPAMCQLFPYTFTNTPSGTYASVSFAATGVLFNLGRPLSDQRELLSEKLILFNQLFPLLKLDWNDIQLIDGQSLSFHDYLEGESTILAKLGRDDLTGRSERILFEEGERFRKRISAPVKLDNAANILVNQKIIDQVLVRNLLATYFPDNVYESGMCEVDAEAVAREFMAEPHNVTFAHGAKSFGFQALLDRRIGRLPVKSRDLLRRFCYLKIFSKLYFGPGFNYLSVVAGLHHVVILACLLRIRLKLELLSRDLSNFSDDDCFEILAETIRVLERRLTVSTFSRDAIAMLEVLLLSPKRVERILELSA
ncbi:MAG: YkgJ family cysteine cluster protein [Candidatus Obscuribacterales bacterium]|nr:YkgJ family cysteine cluster protein [Candidatus Obscuribacterales bacterium]